MVGIKTPIVLTIAKKPNKEYKNPKPRITPNNMGRNGERMREIDTRTL